MSTQCEHTVTITKCYKLKSTFIQKIVFLKYCFYFPKLMSLLNEMSCLHRPHAELLEVPTQGYFLAGRSMMWFTVSRPMNVLQYQPVMDPGYPRLGRGDARKFQRGHTNPNGGCVNLLFWSFSPQILHQIEKKILPRKWSTSPVVPPPFRSTNINNINFVQGRFTSESKFW